MEKINIRQEVADFNTAMMQLKEKLKAKIMALPQNKNIIPLGDGHSCFIISSKTLLESHNWTPFYHDFKRQYEYLCKLIDMKTMDDLIFALNMIVETGAYRSNSYTSRFHPTVVEYLKGIY